MTAPQPTHRPARPIHAVAQERALEIDEWRKNPEKYRPIPTHLPDLNNIINGIPTHRPFIMVVKAMKKLGKTTLAMDLVDAWRAGLPNEPIVFFQCEELVDQYVDRIFSKRTSLTKDDIMMLRINDDQMQEIYEVAQAMIEGEHNLYLQDDVFTYEAMRKVMAELNCNKAVIDNFQVMDVTTSPGLTMQERYALNSKKLLTSRNRDGCSWIVVSQESEIGKTFGSSALDRDGDILIGMDVVYQKDAEEEDVEVPNLRKVIVYRSRLSRDGLFIAGFDGAKNSITHIANRKVEDLTFEKIVEQEGLPAQQTILFTGDLK